MPLDPERLCRFLGNLRLTKGRWAGQPLRLHPFQRDLTLDVFRLDPEDRARRLIREALIGIGRKNGKTTLTAGWGLGLLVLDGEAGGEVVVAASKRDQARFIHDTARRMVQQSSVGQVPLAEFLQVKRDSIYFPELDAVMRVVSADAEKELGANPHAVLCDELGSWPNRHLYDALTTAVAARTNPLIINITTAGAVPSGLAFDLYTYGKQHPEDESFLLRWWEAPEGCELDDEEAWQAANPAYPEFPTRDYLARAAKRKPEYVFRRLHLNQWTTAHERWIPHAEWTHEDNLRDPEFPDGSRITIGLDAALRRDTFGLAMARVDDAGDVHVKVRAFTPSTPEGYIDLTTIEDVLLGMAARYDVEVVVYDPAFMTLLADRLRDRGLPMEPYPQSPMRMTEAAETFQRLVLDHRLRHGGEPTLSNQMANVAIRTSDRGVRISKGRSGGHIDTVVAAAMAVQALVGDEGGEDGFAVVV